MKIGVLGTGVVGQTIGGKLVELGHQVRIGSRSAGKESARAWAQRAGEGASEGSFAQAADFGEVLFNCTLGMASLEALASAGEARLRGKILVDVANPLDFSGGMPPTLAVCNTDSLGEQIQRAFPGTRVVKTLNTMTVNVMVNPALVPGDHVAFLSGDDETAREEVAGYLREWFGWRSENLIELGDITTARGTEMMLPVWVRLWSVLGTPIFNFHLAVADA